MLFIKYIYFKTTKNSDCKNVLMINSNENVLLINLFKNAFELLISLEPEYLQAFNVWVKHGIIQNFRTP